MTTKRVAKSISTSSSLLTSVTTSSTITTTTTTKSIISKDNNNISSVIDDDNDHDDSSYITVNVPVHIISVTCGTNFTIAIDNNGDLYSWGWNESGCLGQGKTSV